MKMTDKRTKTYRVICDVENTISARNFAEKHASANTIAEVKVYGRTFFKHPRVVILFKSNESETTVYKAFMDEFKNYDVKINGRTLTINKRVKFY